MRRQPKPVNLTPPPVLRKIRSGASMAWGFPNLSWPLSTALAS